MLRMIKKLTPSFSVNLYTKNFSTHHLINITINEECFFIEYNCDNISSYTTNILISDIKNFFQSIYPKEYIDIHQIPNITPDQYHKQQILISLNNEYLSLSLPLEFLNHISNHFGYSYHYKAKNIKDLHLELYRFRPYIINPESWFQHPSIELKNVFYQMIVHHVATPKMFALFFKKINIFDFKKYFSQTIAQNIQEEFSLLEQEEPTLLLESVYYIIERNLFLYLQSSNLFLEQQTLISYYQDYFYDISIPKLKLDKFPKIVDLFNSPKITLFLQKTPYASIISFLAYSDESNKSIFQKGFSKESWKQLLQDIDISPFSQKESNTLIYQIAQYISAHNSFEELVDQYIKQDRDWEFIAREGDIRDLFLCFDSTKISPTGGIIVSIYKAYKQNIIVFPDLKNRSIIEALNRTKTVIVYLHLLGYFSS